MLNSYHILLILFSGLEDSFEEVEESLIIDETNESLDEEEIQFRKKRVSYCIVI